MRKFISVIMALTLVLAVIPGITVRAASTNGFEYKV